MSRSKHPSIRICCSPRTLSRTSASRNATKATCADPTSIGASSAELPPRTPTSRPNILTNVASALTAEATHRLSAEFWPRTRANPLRAKNLFALGYEDIQDEAKSREDLLEHLAV